METAMASNAPKIIGAVTVGQAPRPDIAPDVEAIFGAQLRLEQAGALDDVTDFAAIEPDEGDFTLVSLLRDGRSVLFAERKILPNLQRAINRLEDKGASAIMVWCTGEFPDCITANVPLIYPNRLLAGMVHTLRPKRLAVIMPDASQLDEARTRWTGLVDAVDMHATSPYGDGAEESLARTAARIAEDGADLVILDCMGFSPADKAHVEGICRCPVLLPRTLTARVAREIA